MLLQTRVCSQTHNHHRPSLAINDPTAVRKAYRKKALETHPDRLPQGASPAQKSASEEMFRKVTFRDKVLISLKQIELIKYFRLITLTKSSATQKTAKFVSIVPFYIPSQLSFRPMTSTGYGLLRLPRRVTLRATGILLDNHSKIHFFKTPFPNIHFSVAIIKQIHSSHLHIIRTSRTSQTLSYSSIGCLEISTEHFQGIHSVIHSAIGMMVLVEGSCLQYPCLPLRVHHLDSSPGET